MSDLFHCGVCNHLYDEDSQKPISLPCGHVYCHTCISPHQKFQCPVDKTTHETQNLPCCYVILLNLPKAKSKELCCSEHPSKKVKYHCKIHDTFLCTDCVIMHSGSGHVLETVSVNTTNMRNKLQDMTKAFSQKHWELYEFMNTVSDKERKLTSFYENQMLKVNIAFESAIKALQHKKKENTAQLIKYHNEQKKNIEIMKSKVGKQLSSSQHYKQLIKNFTDGLETHYYNEYYRFIQTLQKEISRFEMGQIEDLSYYFFKDTIKIADYGSLTKISNDQDEAAQQKSGILLRIDNIPSPDTPGKNNGSVTSRGNSQNPHNAPLEKEIPEDKSPLKGNENRGRVPVQKCDPATLKKHPVHKSRRRMLDNSRKHNRSFQ